MKDILSNPQVIVNHDIGDGQWEFVFRTSCIEITVINTDSYFSILLENGNDVNNPIWMLFLPYEATCNEFMDFGFNSFHNIWAKSALLLLNCLASGLMFRRCMATCESSLGISS